MELLQSWKKTYHFESLIIISHINYTFVLIYNSCIKVPYQTTCSWVGGLGSNKEYSWNSIQLKFTAIDYIRQPYKSMFTVSI